MPLDPEYAVLKTLLCCSHHTARGSICTMFGTLCCLNRSIITMPVLKATDLGLGQRIIESLRYIPKQHPSNQAATRNTAKNQ